MSICSILDRKAFKPLKDHQNLNSICVKLANSHTGGKQVKKSACPHRCARLPQEPQIFNAS